MSPGVGIPNDVLDDLYSKYPQNNRTSLADGDEIETNQWDTLMLSICLWTGGRDGNKSGIRHPVSGLTFHTGPATAGCNLVSAVLLFDGLPRDLTTHFDLKFCTQEVRGQYQAVRCKLRNWTHSQKEVQSAIQEAECSICNIIPRTKAMSLMCLHFLRSQVIFLVLPISVRQRFWCGRVSAACDWANRLSAVRASSGAASLV